MTSGRRVLRCFGFPFVGALAIGHLACGRRNVPTPVQDAAVQSADASERVFRFESPPAHGRASKGSDPLVVVLSSHVGPSDRDKAWHLAAYDSSSLKQLWLTPLPASIMHELLVIGERVVLHHSSPQVDLHNLRTGALVSSVALSDKVYGWCENAPNVFVRVADNKHVMLDTTSGGTRAAEEPTWCRPSCDFDEGQRCFFEEYGRKPPELAGFVFQYRLRGHSIDLLVGMKMPGSRIPIVAGVAPGTFTVKWKQLPEQPGQDLLFDSVEGDLDEDGATISYEMAKRRVIGLDPNTGAIRWREEGSFQYARIGARVFLQQRDRIRILDVRTGKLLSTLTL